MLRLGDFPFFFLPALRFSVWLSLFFYSANKGIVGVGNLLSEFMARFWGGGNMHPLGEKDQGRGREERENLRGIGTLLQHGTRRRWDTTIELSLFVSSDFWQDK